MCSHIVFVGSGSGLRFVMLVVTDVLRILNWWFWLFARVVGVESTLRN